MAATRRWIDKCVLCSNDRETRGCPLIPRKVNIFIWRLMLDRIPTRNAIKRRGMEIENVLCPICNVEEENLMHLFGRCEVAARTWEALFKWLDIQVSNFRDPSEFLKNESNLKLNEKKKIVIEAIVCTGLWFLWKYRNDVVHNTGKIRKGMIVDSIKEYSFLWSSNRQTKMYFDWAGWLLNIPLNSL